MTMKFIHSTKKSFGIGLIEVLVATVVVAIGLLGVASLQTNLMSSSRTNKTRDEAKALADSKIEELRDTITKTNYTALASSPPSPLERIGGVTETFTRSWVITNQTNPVTKQVSVTVCWSDGCPPGNNVANKVAVQSVIAFDGLGNSVLSAKSAGQAGTAAIMGPTLNARSSDDISSPINLTTPGTPGTVYTAPDGKTYIVQSDTHKALAAPGCSTLVGLTSFENNLYTRRVDHDGVTGDEAIELYEKNVIVGAEYCLPKVRYNGGVIIPIRGIVHSGATTGNGNNPTLLDVSLFTFNTSESGTYCVFNPQTGAKSAPYVCYVGGNCQYGPNGTTAGNPVTECPNPSVSAAIVGPGGWRGKVGLLGVAANGNNVCFAEELAGTPAIIDTAREYYTRRNAINEGINKPYNCHDFLIINGKNTMAQIHSECVTQATAIGGFQLASKTIQRTITSGNNVFDPTIDTSFCVGSIGTAYAITGTITGAAAAPTVTVSDSTNTNNCTATTSAYTCNITTSATSVTVNGVYNSQPVNCVLTPVSTTGCQLTFTTMPTYTITGHISATTAAAANAVASTIVDGDNTINCTNNQNYSNGYNTYTCSISTLSTTGITINATASKGYAVSPTTYTVPTLSGTTSSVTVPSTANDFVASVVPTYTISGSISTGTNVSNVTSITTAVNTGTGTCTITPPNGANGWSQQNKASNYSCTVYGGSNSLSVAISPTCSNTTTSHAGDTTNAFKKYTLSSTGVITSTTGTGQLVINLGSVSGNQTINISIVESTTDC
jgi:Tfp pilus assembly protein PilV